MAKNQIKNIRQQARKYHQAHLQLKRLLNLPLYRERILELFLGTFVFALLTILIFMNWGKFADLIKKEATEPVKLATIGAQKGAEAAYKISEQSHRQRDEYLARIPTHGYQLGMKASQRVGESEKSEPQEPSLGLENSLLLTNQLSERRHLSSLNKQQTKGLQKSVLATFYFGEKTVTIDDTLDLDTRLLGQISNALSVDIFQYLDQAANRSDQLKGYLNLLIALRIKAAERIGDLNAKITFLEKNAQANEQRLSLTEEQFFDQLGIFGEPNAAEQLKNFIGLQSAQSETKAKLGAYSALMGYYQFFQPRLETMILAINANWDALIAGVKVTEIQNMTLPLIVRP